MFYHIIRVQGGLIEWLWVASDFKLYTSALRHALWDTPKSWLKNELSTIEQLNKEFALLPPQYHSQKTLRKLDCDVLFEEAQSP